MRWQAIATDWPDEVPETPQETPRKPMIKDPDPLPPAPFDLAPKQPINLTVTPTVSPIVNVNIPSGPVWILILLEIIRIWMVMRGSG